jgi:acetaldehyde dehydrogenase (acetylating)
MKIKVAILGTGNIGTDLMLKSIKTDFIDVVAFVGRRLDSPHNANRPIERNINLRSRY